MARHPIQPTILDDKGVLRFKENAIIRFLLDQGPFTMNHLAAKEFSSEDREQFAQLIGYSLCGFGELSYVSEETYNAAEIMSKDRVDEKDAQISYLKQLVCMLRDELRQPMSTLFGVHPDDLGELNE